MVQSVTGGSVDTDNRGRRNRNDTSKMGAAEVVVAKKERDDDSSTQYLYGPIFVLICAHIHATNILAYYSYNDRPLTTRSA